MNKTASLSLGLVLAFASATASATIISFTDSIKRDVAHNTTIDGNHYLLRGNNLGEYDTATQIYRAKLRDTASGVNWNLKLRVDGLTNTFAAGHNPRCPRTELNCDTSDWLHFEENAGRLSVLTQSGGLARYVLDVGWGQYGYNAGGHWVTAQDGNAAGFWIKEWTFQERASRADAWGAVSTGAGGDVNVYEVPEPGMLGLLGLGFALLLRRKLVKA